MEVLQGGGGGAGGLRIICEVSLSTNSAPIVIGAGGTAKGSGSNSSIVGTCGTISSTGGGAQATSGGSGGTGIVIIRAPSSKTLTVSPGTNSTSTHPGGDKLATFTVSGTLTIS